MYSEDEIRAFLVGWLMEFGSGYVQPYQSQWYLSRDENFRGQYFKKFFTTRNAGTPPLQLEARLNQKGLDFIERGTPESSGVQKGHHD